MTTSWNTSQVVAVLLLLAFALAGCSMIQGATPTAVPVVTTAVAPTPVPVQPTATAVPDMVATQVPTPAPTSASSGAACLYKASFVQDVTIPDNSFVAGGSSFTKTWRVRNDGSCAWGTGGHTLNQLIFAGGDQLGGPNAVALPEVQPRSSVDLSVNMVAPTTTGTYLSKWYLASDDGTLLGVGDGVFPLTVKIIVGSAVPSPIVDGPCSYKATFVADVTIPDSSVLSPNEDFTKIWRIRNDGTCTWGTAGFQINKLMFTGGDQMGAPNFVDLPAATINPGVTIDVPVTMRTPANPGTYRGEWKLGDGESASLGTGSTGTKPFYVQLVVSNTSVPIPFVRATIIFRPGDTSTTFNTAVVPQGPQGYTLRVLAGQQMQVTASGGVSVGILDASNNALPTQVDSSGVTTASIPANGDYTVVIYGNGSTTVTMTVPPLP